MLGVEEMAQGSMWMPCKWPRLAQSSVPHVLLSIVVKIVLWIIAWEVFYHQNPVLFCIASLEKIPG